MAEPTLSSSKSQGLYYSSYHLARDLFWNVGVFTSFLILALVIDPALRTDLDSGIRDLAQLNSNALEIGAALAYVALAAVAGVVAPRLFILLTLWTKKTPVRKINYEVWYAEDKAELKETLDQTLWGAAKLEDDKLRLTMRKDPRPMDYLLGLTTYCRIYNPAGYAHVFREYSIVNLYRQASLYSLLLAVRQMMTTTPNWVVVTLLCGMALLWFAPLKRAVKAAVSREYSFIMATLQYLRDNERLRR